MTEEVLDQPVYLTPVELAHRWRVSVRSLERWRTAGTGPAWISVGGGIRYAVEAALDFEARQSGMRARPSKNEGRDER